MGSGDQIQKIFQLFLDDLEHIPDLKSVLDVERVLDNINALLISNVLFKNFGSFTDRSNIFKNMFYAFVFFVTMGSFLIVPFVRVKERSFPRNNEVKKKTQFFSDILIIGWFFTIVRAK